MNGFPRAVGLALASALAWAVPAWAAPADAPITMADPDGQDLTLERLDVRMAASGPLVLTELEMRFRNPLDRQAEGRFACVLPTGATVSRFAKEVGGELMEGEVVERLKARRVYTEILHTLRDPALLEQDQGNRFQARVFPIPARGQVRLLLSYSMLVPMDPDGTRTVTIPVRGLTEIGAFRFRGVFRTLPGEEVVAQGWLGTSRKVVTGDQVVFEDATTRKRFTPETDLRLTFSAGDDAARQRMLRAGEYRMVTLRPELPPTGPAGNPAEWVVYVDTSASGAASAAPRRQALEALLAELEAIRPDARIHLRAFDLAVHELGSWTAREGKAASMTEALAARQFLGATDLAAMLRHAGAAARAPGGPRQVLLVTDAVPSLGDREPGELVAALGEWPLESRLHVVSLGSLIDQRVADALAEAGRGRVQQVPLTTRYSAAVREAVAQLRRPVGASFQVRAPGAAWVQPDFFEDVVAGQELVAFVKGAPEAVHFEQLGGVKAEVAGPGVETPDFAPLLERQATRAYLEHLDREVRQSEDPERAARLRAEMLELSTTRRVLCPLTSMLVLETEADYRRFGIDRRALVDIMVVGRGGIELLERSDPDAPPPRTSPVEEKNKDKVLRKSLPDGDPASAFDDAFGDDQVRATEVSASADEVLDAGDRSFEEAPADASPLGDAEYEADADGFGGGQLRELPRSTSVLGGAPGGGGEASGMAMGSAPPPPAPRELRAQLRQLSRSSQDVSAEGGSSGRLRDWAPPPGEGLVSEDVPAPEPLPVPGLQPVRRRPTSPGTVQRRRPVRHKAPAWTDQATYRPSARELRELAAEVAAAPKDRRKRNSYCWALAKAGKWDQLREAALAWQPYDPRNPMVYEYLGTALSRLGDDEGALRAFSTTAEIAPGESGLLNRAGFLALRAEQYEMAATLFRVAIERRPEHANNYRGLALALWSAGRHAEAAEVYQDALARDYHSRYKDVKRVLREEASHLLQAWARAEPGSSLKVKEWAAKLGADLDLAQDLRITLHWETDANDVDLHVVDPRGEESYYSHKQTASGVRLYEDLTQGLGPELTVVPQGRLLKGTYHVGVKYFAAGPMGVSRGVVVIQRPTEDGLPDVSIHPFTLLPDLAGRQQDMRHVAVAEG